MVEDNAVVATQWGASAPRVHWVCLGLGERPVWPEQKVPREKLQRSVKVRLQGAGPDEGEASGRGLAGRTGEATQGARWCWGGVTAVGVWKDRRGVGISENQLTELVLGRQNCLQGAESPRINRWVGKTF